MSPTDRLNEQAFVGLAWYDRRPMVAASHECCPRVNAQATACFLAAVTLGALGRQNGTDMELEVFESVLRSDLGSRGLREKRTGCQNKARKKADQNREKLDHDGTTPVQNGTLEDTAQPLSIQRPPP
jgi:hypothetical protein